MSGTHGRGTGLSRPVTADPKRTIAGLVCVLTAVAASSFVFSAWAHSSLPVTRSYVSELEGAGQPYQVLFRLSDVLSGVGLIMVALLVLGLLTKGTRSLAGCALLAVAGVASLCDAANPMSCIPSIDAACRAEQDTTSGLIRQVVEPHTTSSMVGFCATGGAMLLFGVAAASTDPVFSRLSVACAIVTGALGIADVVLILTQGLVGLSERGRILVFSLWLLALGARFLRPTTSVAWNDPLQGRQPTATMHCVPAERPAPHTVERPDSHEERQRYDGGVGASEQSAD
jgi:hypothetical membrane protein